MIIQTKAFQEAANKILLAVSTDKTNAANVELEAKDNVLYLRTTNKEFYVEIKFDLESAETFRAVVDANLFLNLISSITTDTFEITINENVTINTLLVKAGKSNYKLALIYENEELMQLPAIRLFPDQVKVEMNIAHDILSSILNVNSKEIQKAKHIDVNELQRYYYIDETGCFTFTTGACVNSFTLDQPIRLLLNEKVVKLFKLFTTDAYLRYGYVPEGNELRPIVTLQAGDNIYIAAKLQCDDKLISKIKAPCDAMKNLIKESYAHNLVLSATLLSAAISRLLMFTKNSGAKVESSFIPAFVEITQNELTIYDSSDNSEVIAIENGSSVDGTYSMGINLIDLKSVLDSCKNEHITMNCGNHKSVIINRGPISNVVAEARIVK